MKTRVVIRENYAKLGYDIFIVQEDADGKVYMGKPTAIEMIEVNPYSNHESTVHVSGLNIDIETPELKKVGKELIDTVNKDKNEHINNLNEIIDKVLGKI